MASISQSHTFSVIAREYLEKRAADALADTTISKSEWLLVQLGPRLGRMPITDIDAPMLLNVLKEVQGSGRLKTARRLRFFAGRVIDYAVITGRANYSPAPPLRRALITPTVRHHPAIIDRKQLGATRDRRLSGLPFDYRNLAVDAVCLPAAW